MNIIKEPYHPNWYRFTEENSEYTHIYKKYIHIQIGKAKVIPEKTLVPAVMLVASVGFSFLWLPILLVNLLTILVWVLVPSMRPINQLSRRYMIQEGQGTAANVCSPYVNWTLCNHSELYASAFHEWLEALRSSGNPRINRDDWIRYFGEIEELVPDREIAFSNTKPDFEKIKILKELMQ